MESDPDISDEDRFRPLLGQRHGFFFLLFIVCFFAGLWMILLHAHPNRPDADGEEKISRRRAFLFAV
jgi:hypothetical protein